MNKAKNFTTIISILILCTMMLGILTGCGSSKTDAASAVAVPDWVNGLSDEAVAAAKTIIANGKLVLGTSADYAPFEFHTEINGTDTIVGFDVSIAQFMSEQLGVELEVVDMSFDNVIALMRMSRSKLLSAFGKVGTRVLFMDDGQILEDGTPEQIF